MARQTSESWASGYPSDVQSRLGPVYLLGHDHPGAGSQCWLAYRLLLCKRGVFEKGEEHLRPLAQREVADHVEMHESTVLRFANKKYVQTPRGVLPLKFFFSGGLPTDYGDDVSSRRVRLQIKKIVSKEDPKAPFTDPQIVDLLRKDGIQIARRTVAKYRDELGLLSARLRKRV